MYVVGDSYGGLQSAAAQQQAQQAENFWRLIQSNRAAQAAENQNALHNLTLALNIQKLTADDALSAKGLALTKRGQDITDRRDRERTEYYNKKLKERQEDINAANADNRFSDLYSEIWSGRIPDSNTLAAMEGGKLSSDRYNALMTALAQSQQKRQKDYDVNTADLAESLNREIAVPGTTDQNYENAVKEYEGSHLFGIGKEGDWKAVQAALDAIISARKLSADAALKRNKSAAGRVYYDPAEGDFKPRSDGPGSQELDALWYLGIPQQRGGGNGGGAPTPMTDPSTSVAAPPPVAAPQTVAAPVVQQAPAPPPAVALPTPSRNRSVTVAPEQPARTMDPWGGPSPIPQFGVDSFERIVYDLRTGRITPQQARARRESVAAIMKRQETLSGQFGQPF